MPDHRTIERWIERAFEAVEQLTRQVARAAYAFEAQKLAVMGTRPEPCKYCLCRLVPWGYGSSSTTCPACGMPLEEEKKDG